MSNADDVEIKYGHIIQVLTDWIDTTILVSVDGRGMAKSTVIQARRSARGVNVRLSWMITSMFIAFGMDVLFSWDHWITLRCLPESL